MLALSGACLGRCAVASSARQPIWRSSRSKAHHENSPSPSEQRPCHSHRPKSTRAESAAKGVGAGSFKLRHLYFSDPRCFCDLQRDVPRLVTPAGEHQQTCPSKLQPLQLSMPSMQEHCNDTRSPLTLSHPPLLRTPASRPGSRPSQQGDAPKITNVLAPSDESAILLPQ